jgi:peptidoglycan/LPS O-acetylase OafA/YrhL
MLGYGNPWLYMVSYLSGSLAWGWLLAYLIEEPLLRLRDRWFPSQRRPEIPSELEC